MVKCTFNLRKYGSKKIPARIVIDKEVKVIDTDNEIINDIISQNNIQIDKISAENLIHEINQLSVQDQAVVKINEENKVQEIEEEIKVSPEKMDDNIYDVFLTTIKICITDDMLPLDPGKLYKEYMKKVAKELNIPVDIKHSTHKKINNFLKSISKSQKIINFGKPSSSQSNEYILCIHRDNPL